ncbi:MAG: hypothetical protein HYV38_00510 [Candidatus Levybacteria bacterium]|nr:hypothetical protein [Candidatus Levybacteria bacterium]
MKNQLNQLLSHINRFIVLTPNKIDKPTYFKTLKVSFALNMADTIFAQNELKEI